MTLTEPFLLQGPTQRGKGIRKTSVLVFIMLIMVPFRGRIWEQKTLEAVHCLPYLTLSQVLVSFVIICFAPLSVPGRFT
jgi:hypothetical protein